MSKPKKTARKEPPCCMYIGPTVRGVISHGQIFAEAADAVRARLADSKCPDCAVLVIDSKELPEARRQVRTSGTALNHIYQSLCKR